VGVTERGAERAGRRRAEKRSAPRAKRPYVVLLALGVVASAAAWVFLVRAAIDFGQLARGGRSAAWVVCGASTIGAAVCLLLVFVLVSRAWTALGLSSDYQPRRSSGGRRSR
jgi:hypothetical protein